MEILSATRSWSNESEGAGMTGCVAHKGLVLKWFKTEKEMETYAKMFNLTVRDMP
jgi:hypothetical protein